MRRGPGGAREVVGVTGTNHSFDGRALGGQWKAAAHGRRRRRRPAACRRCSAAGPRPGAGRCGRFYAHLAIPLAAPTPEHVGNGSLDLQQLVAPAQAAPLSCIAGQTLPPGQTPAAPNVKVLSFECCSLLLAPVPSAAAVRSSFCDVRPPRPRTARLRRRPQLEEAAAARWQQRFNSRVDLLRHTPLAACKASWCEHSL